MLESGGGSGKKKKPAKKKTSTSKVKTKTTTSTTATTASTRPKITADQFARNQLRKAGIKPTAKGDVKELRKAFAIFDSSSP